MTALPSIPRLYTALAECLAVGIYALPLSIRFGKTATIAASAAWALALSAFLQATGSVPLAWWIPCMAAAVGIQYLYLWVTRTISLLEAGYVCARAFVLAELAASISEHGLLQPIAVRPHGVDRYLIVAGERRWRACRMAGLTEAPVVVKDVTDEQAMELALVENLQREDLDPVEEAAGIRELMTRCDLTQEQAARKLGKSRSALANSLRLLNLPETVLELLKSGFINTGHAKVVLGLPTPELQAEAAQIIADNQLNVRQAETLCKKMAKPAKEPREPAPRGTLPVEVEESLKQVLGSEVNVAYHGGKGKLTVHFYSDEQLRAFANLLGQYQMETE